MEGVEEGVEQKDNESMDEFEMTLDLKVTKNRGKIYGGPSKNPSYLTSNLIKRTVALGSARTESTSTEEDVDMTEGKRVNTNARRVYKPKQSGRSSVRLESWEQKTLALKSSKTDSASSAGSREEGEETVVKQQEKEKTIHEEKGDSKEDERPSPGQIPLKQRPNRNKKPPKRSDDFVYFPSKRNSKSPTQKNSSSVEASNVSKDYFTKTSDDGVEKTEPEKSKSTNENKSCDSSDEKLKSCDISDKKISQIVQSHVKIMSDDSTEREESRKTSENYKNVPENKNKTYLNESKIKNKISLNESKNKNKTSLNESTINKMSDDSLLEMAAKDGFDVNESILFLKPKPSRPKLKLQAKKKDHSETSKLINTVHNLETNNDHKKEDLIDGTEEALGEEVAARPGKNYRRSLSMQLFPEKRLFQRSILGTPRQSLAHSRESIASRPSSFARLSSARASSFSAPNLPTKNSSSSVLAPNLPTNNSSSSVLAPNPSSRNASSSILAPNPSTRNNSSSFVAPNPQTRRLSTRQSSVYNRHRPSSILTQTLVEEPEELIDNPEVTLVGRIDETVAMDLETFDESAANLA